MKRRFLIRGVLMVMASALLLLVCLRYQRAQTPRALRLSNQEQIIAGIRHGLRGHSSCITVRFETPEDVRDGLADTVRGWIEAALAETDDPTEGDYIRYQYGGYEMTCSAEPSDAGQCWRVEIRPGYYLYPEQEEAVTEALAGVYPALGLDRDASDLQKLEAIYGYVCGSVTYDRVHSKNPYFHEKSTAWSALIRRTATCQGYAVLLYRMLRDNGIGCRIVTGTADGDAGPEFHAWNIAELDGQYYYLDATWDAGKPPEAWSCFLKGSGSFAGHEPDPQFASPEFASVCPISPEDKNR